ncbi:SET domain-containing protein-lysine N-methyltransferase [Legionella clemsonensis]|uniref:SET domain protein n=1 Tax=Legionella clemsonensis TaxID=1867846 RepID=A0A222P2M2_9GAMM|nr:SET domain-containing protein-lysine N-methyltransferase [Legionella clemsonensis]ASQ46098.1 SET domain protein [Legionella clemsonensis]
MVKITLTNQNPDSSYRKAIVDVGSKICIIDDQEKNLDYLRAINFQHPLLTYPALQSTSNSYHYSYTNVDELLKTARYIYATLLQSKKPEDCQFVISPSPKFHSLKTTYQIPFSLDPHKPAKNRISVNQLNELISHLSNHSFRFIDNLIIEETLSLDNLPSKINGNTLFNFDKKTYLFLHKADPFEKIELRYINGFIGFGVYAKETILRGEFVCLYHGIKKSIPDMKRYYFNFHLDVLGLGTDARFCSNIARFINHAPALARVKQFDSSLLYANLGYKRYFLYGIEVVGFIALRNIAKGEQLFIDYGPEYFDPTEEYRFNISEKLTDPMGSLLKEKYHEKLSIWRIMAKNGITQAAYRLLKRPIIALFIALVALSLIYSL